MALLWQDNLGNGNFLVFQYFQTYAVAQSQGGNGTRLASEIPQGVSDLRLATSSEPRRLGSAMRVEIIQGQAWGGDVLRSAITVDDDTLWTGGIANRGAIPGQTRAVAVSIYLPDTTAEAYHPQPNREHNVLQGIHGRTGFDIPWDSAWTWTDGSGRVTPYNNSHVYRVDTYKNDWPFEFDVAGGAGFTSEVLEKTPVFSLRKLVNGVWVRDPDVFNIWHDLVWETHYQYTGTPGNSAGWYSLWHKTEQQSTYTQIRNQRFHPTLFFDDFPYMLTENYMGGGAVFPVSSDGVSRSVEYVGRHRAGNSFADVAITALGPSQAMTVTGEPITDLVRSARAHGDGRDY